MNVKNFLCAIFVVSSFCKVTSGYSFHKTFKSPKEKYEELVEEKDKLEILERSNFSIEEDENENEKPKGIAEVDHSCPRATATAQVHVRFGKEPGEHEKNGDPNNIQRQIYEKRSLMFDPYLYQQFLYYMFLNGGQFGLLPNCGTPNFGNFYNPNRRIIPDYQNFHYCPYYSNSRSSPNYYNPNAQFPNPKRNCKSSNKSNKQIRNWDNIQNVPVNQLTKQELKLVLKYLDNEENENDTCSSKVSRNHYKESLEDSFGGATASPGPVKKCQKRSVTENCKFSSYSHNSGLKVTSNLELIAVDLNTFW